MLAEIRDQYTRARKVNFLTASQLLIHLTASEGPLSAFLRRKTRFYYPNSILIWHVQELSGDRSIHDTYHLIWSNNKYGAHDARNPLKTNSAISNRSHSKNLLVAKMILQNCPRLNETGCRTAAWISC